MQDVAKNWGACHDPIEGGKSPHCSYDVWEGSFLSSRLAGFLRLKSAFPTHRPDAHPRLNDSHSWSWVVKQRRLKSTRTDLYSADTTSDNAWPCGSTFIILNEKLQLSFSRSNVTDLMHTDHVTQKWLSSVVCWVNHSSYSYGGRTVTLPTNLSHCLRFGWHKVVHHQDMFDVN